MHSYQLISSRFPLLPNSTDTRAAAYHAGGWEGDEEEAVGPEGKEGGLVLPSLTLVG